MFIDFFFRCDILFLVVIITIKEMRLSLRNTKQKELILSIINRSCSHPTVQEIYDECRKKIPNISLGTVYRNLNFLVNHSLVRRIRVSDHIDRYDKWMRHHAHFICIRCQKVIDLDDDHKIDPMINGHKVVDYEVSFKGICKDCLKKESEFNGTKGK